MSEAKDAQSWLAEVSPQPNWGSLQHS